MNKVTVVIVSIIILCFGGFVIWAVSSSKSGAIDFDLYDPSTVIQPSDDNGQIGDRVRGNAESPVVFIEYADFQCPGCAAIYPNIEILFGEYSDRVAFVFRHFPLSAIHPNAKASAAAAEAAGIQGYFFEMTNSLFINQSVWSLANGSERAKVFAELFKQIAPEGDVDKFKSDMASTEVSKKVSFDTDLGTKRNNITGTPTFFVNNDRIDLAGSSAEASFLSVIREHLDAKLAEHDLPTGSQNPSYAEEHDPDDGHGH